MRKIFISLQFLIIALSSMAQDIIPINENWKFRRSGEDTWYDARVPGTVHTDLMAQNLIEDPYFGTNFLKQEWIKDVTWEYQTEFSVDDDLFNSDKIELVFHGLDTKAEVFLNDSILFRSDNMFRSWSHEVSRNLKEGKNTIRVLFYPPTETSRKAMFQSGIDPKIQTCGIWKPVELVAWSRVKMYNTGIIQNEISENEVKITVHTEMDVVRPFIGDLDIYLDGEIVKSSKVDMTYGKNYQNISFSVHNPKRWWPAGMGDQKRYDVAIVLKNEGFTVASQHKKIGIRTFKIKETDGRSGSVPELLVNNKKMQVVCGNFVPMDFFIPRADSLRYKNILKAIVNTGFNVVRVWGGGIYENEVFYNLCDEAGLLVIQDLMFDFSRIADTDSIVSDVLAEAEENIRRMHHHPSLMLWTNVNVSFLCENSDLTNAVSRHDIKTIFSKKEEKDYSAKDHLWLEWLKSMQGGNNVSYSCPGNIFSVSGKDMIIDNPVWEKRSNPATITELKGDLAANFPEANDLRELIYQSQLLQAKRILSPTINHMNYVSQINESWPGISTSVIDYSGKMKGAAYKIRRNVHKEIVGIEEKDKYIRINVFSIPGDTEEKFDLDIRVMDFSGKLFYKEEKKIKTDEHKPVVRTDISKKEIFKKRQNGSAYICVKLKKEDLIISESRMFFVPLDEIKFEESKISLDVFEVDSEIKVEVKSDKLAMGVVLYTENDAVEWSDNFFNLDPGEKKVVSVQGSRDIKSLKNNIRSMVLYRERE